MRTTLIAALLLGGTAGTLPAAELTVLKQDGPALDLGSYAVPGGRTLQLHEGIGSGLAHGPSDPDRIVWSVADRGPNIDCGDAEKVLGVERRAICGETRRGRIYPRPDYAPTIYQLRLDPAAGTFTVLDELPLRTGDGRTVSGLPNPLTVAETEQPLDGQGNELAQDPAAVDAEAIVHLADGTFWLAEENAPSLVQVDATGTITKRLVPAGTEQDFRAAGYPVEGSLPAILAKRQRNRGLESLAIDRDERFLYAMMQSPLANPDGDTYRQAKNARILKIDRASGRPVAEYVYTMEPMAGFAGEAEKPQSTARVSELLHLEDERFLVDDRTDRTTHLLAIDLAGATDILGSRWDDPATSPSLEATDLAAAGIVPVGKRRVLDSAAHPELPGKLEGMALLKNGTLVLINDDDFGIEGAATTIVLVEDALPAR